MLRVAPPVVSTTAAPSGQFVEVAEPAEEKQPVGSMGTMALF